MSSRLAKWLFVLALVIVALYAAYPPVRVPVKEVRIVEKPGEDPESEVVDSTFLPLALGERFTETVEHTEDDGTKIKRQTTYVEGRIKLGLDIAGGTQLVYELKHRRGEKVGGTMDETIKTLRQRVDPQNVKEFRIQAVGENRILIQVPRATQAEVERLKDRLTRMGRLEFKLAMTPGDPEFEDEYQRARAGKEVPDYEKMFVEGNKENRFFLVREGDAEITGKLLQSASFTRDDKGLPAVGFLFNSRGRTRFASITERNRGWSLAIILDGTLKSAPVIQSRIAGQGIIEGKFTRKEVEDLVTILRAGSLPVDVELLQESTVGPKLGRDAIGRGLNSIMVAGALILLFIGIYYLRCGAVADGALILNLIFLTGVLGILGAALTLPGVAGILLTVGMAVDANVLIFERIREESEAGKTVHVALRNGYDRAYTTIIDANVTTLLTAIILYMVGTGPVRGFAVTLSAGIVLSMFTALFVTRLALETFVSRGWIEDFKMFSVVGTPDVSYSSRRRVAFVASAVVVLIGLGAFFSRGAALYDVDFTGGSLVHLSFDEPTPAGRIRDKLADAGYPDAQVQGIRRGAEGESRRFRVRIKGVGRRRLRNEIRPAVLEGLKGAGIFGEGDSLRIGADGRSLELKLAQPAAEMDIRTSLAGEQGDLYGARNVSEIIPPDDLTSTRFIIRVGELPAIPKMLEIWEDLVRVARFALVQQQACRLSFGEVQTGEPEEGPATVKVTTGRPIQWQQLALELRRRQFGTIDVVPREEPSDTFDLRADRAKLEQMLREMPGEVNLPVITFEGASITAELTEEASEIDLRAYAGREELASVYVVPLDAEAAEYTLQLSHQPVKQRLNGMFAEGGGRSTAVSFEVLEEEADEQGRVQVRMDLSPPQTFEVVKYYLEEAGFGGQVRDMIVDEPESPEVKMSSVVLRVPRSELEATQELVSREFEQAHPVQQIMSIGAVVATEMKGRALLAVICASIVIVFYVALRFHALRFGVAAVIAVVHDVMITAGLIALADWTGLVGDIKINLAMLAAFLTILGYSLNDTIVVFDRIRENTVEAGKKALSGEVVDLSINQVLSRTILTSATTLVAVLALYVLGGAELRGLAFTLIIGVVVGTYSSIFIASPVLLDWNKIVGGLSTVLHVIFYPFRMLFWLLGKLLG
jgi:protein-export membrane protein SecD/preprotein translocase SecF subunit